MRRHALLLILGALAAPACAEDGTGPPGLTADTVASPGAVSVTAGEPEIVLRYRADSCEPEDLPDIQARAFRRTDNTVVLVSGNAPRNYWMAGTGFNALTRICSPVLVSGDDPRAEMFDAQEWIVSVYREGNVVHALVHNEYHDPGPRNCKPGDTSPANPCWYNAITYASSTDGARTFRQLAAPAHVVAAAPKRWDPVTLRGAPGPYGYFSPSNIVRGRDGAFYAVFFAIPDRDRQTERGTCLMRTTNLAEPSSWRAWDGTGFTIRMASAYVTDGAPPCAFIAPRELADLHGSLTYNRYLDRYLLVGTSVESNGAGGYTCGFFFSLSPDLVRWTPRQLLRPARQPFPPCTTAGPEGSEIYPSIIDHADTSTNFEFSFQAPYLYYVRWNQGLNRDLLRVSIRFELAQGS